ncbi:MAG: hypothetical protein AAF802_22290 [Planctomycetota bacterium]
MIDADRLRPIDFNTFPSGGADGRLLHHEDPLFERFVNAGSAAHDRVYCDLLVGLDSL